MTTRAEVCAEAALAVFGTSKIETPHGDYILPVVMTAIAGAESGWIADRNGDKDLPGPNCDGYTSWGLWQIHSVHSAYLTAQTGSSDPCVWAKWLSDPTNNAKAAVAIYEGQGLAAWTTYNTGAYLAYLSAAQAAVATVVARREATHSKEETPVSQSTPAPSTMPPCIQHGKIVAEVEASEVNSAIIFQLELQNPDNPLPEPLSIAHVLDTGDFELAIPIDVFNRLGLKQMGSITVGVANGQSAAAPTSIVRVTAPKGSPVPFSWLCTVVGMAGLRTGLFGRRAVAMRGLGMITEGIPPKTPGDYLSFQGYTRIAFYEGVGYQGPTDPSNVAAG